MVCFLKDDGSHSSRSILAGSNLAGLITTRIRAVARVTRHIRQVYVLCQLSNLRDIVGEAWWTRKYSMFESQSRASHKFRLALSILEGWTGYQSWPAFVVLSNYDRESLPRNWEPMDTLMMNGRVVLIADIRRYGSKTRLSLQRYATRKQDELNQLQHEQELYRRCRVLTFESCCCVHLPRA